MTAMLRIRDEVRLVHPNLPGQVYRAPRKAVGKLRRCGWRPAPPALPSPPPSPDPDRDSESTKAPATAGVAALPRRRRAASRGDE